MSENRLAHQVLILSTSFVFAYILGIIIHEIGHVAAYALVGIPTDAFVIHPFGRNYMLPAQEAPKEFIPFVYMAGTLLNLITATALWVTLKRTRNSFLLPLLMLSATSFIQESIGIILDVVNGGDFDWAIVSDTALPTPVIFAISSILLVIGCIQFLKMLAMVRVRKDLKQAIMVALSVVTPYFLLSLGYVLLFEENKIPARAIALGVSVILGISLSVIYTLNQSRLEVGSLKIETRHVRFSVVLMLTLLCFGLTFFN